MDLRGWLERQAPDFLSTFRRFPFAIVLAALNTVVVIGAINEIAWLRDEAWARAALGLSTAAVCAVAGVYFRESRPEARGIGMVLAWLLPLAAIGLFQVTDIAFVVPWTLPAISILWLSVSPFTRIASGAEREAQQSRFWIINHQALASAAIAGGAFGVIALGLVAIERSLSLLFGIEAGSLFYKWLLPFTGLFLSPFYWLSTLPRLSEIDASASERPEFIGKAVGFLGQFVLVPMLLIYALILLAYTAQIIVTQRLPEGMIGWMVTGFVIVGAATWLVLYPPFMRERALVRFFRRWWFWLTLVPLGLFFIAVYIRVEAYGFTDERMLLLAGGGWAALLAAAFLLGRGDIRLIPALAGAILLLVSIGPWNYSHLPMIQHLGRLEAVILNAGADQSASPPRADWSAAEVATARGSIDYLTQSNEGRQRVRQLFGRYGVTWSPDQDGAYVVFEALGQDMQPDPAAQNFVTLRRDLDRQFVDVSATPFLVRPVAVYGSSVLAARPLWFEGKDGVLRVGPFGSDAEAGVPIDLAAWFERQGSTFAEPWIDFSVAGANYRLVVNSLSFERNAGPSGQGALSYLEGELFAAQPPAAP